MIDKYLAIVREKLEKALIDEHFIGRLEVEVNIKHRGIVNMNIATRESVKI